jgi:hypothetical protein
MSQVARALLLKLLAQVDRGGRDSVPIGDRSAHAYFEVTDLEERDALHAYLANAEAAGGVTLEWGRRTASQDLRRIRIKDPDLLAAWLGVSRTAVQARTISQGLAEVMADAPGWLRDAFAEALTQWRLGHSPYRIPPADTTAAINLFRIAHAVAVGEQEGLDLRRFSVRLLGNSKAVESLLGRLSGLLRRNPDWSIWQADADLFRALGLEKFPPALFIKGPLVLNYDGAHWDLTALRPFVGLSPDAVNQIQASAPVPYLLTIENLASFQRQVREIPDAGVVIYTAGFPAPALVRVLGQLDQCLPDDCPFYHWGDRDIGGLRILARVVAACPRHEVSPHLMSAPDPGSGPYSGGWSRDERRALEQAIAKGGSVDGLAAEWVQRDLGKLEQEALDPASPPDREQIGGLAIQSHEAIVMDNGR